VFWRILILAASNDLATAEMRKEATDTVAVCRGGAQHLLMRSAGMNIEEAVTAATAGSGALLSCLGQPVVAYHVTAIMRETDKIHARQMQLALLRRSIEALVDDGFEDLEAEIFASQFDGRVDSAWDLLHMAGGTPH
jgi:hypothetical protein